MASKISIESSGRFGTAFHKALDDKGLSLVEFARMIDGQYESQRKILIGKALPGKRLLPIICKKLGLNVKEMQNLVAKDRMEMKVGKAAFSSALGFTSPRIGDFDVLLPYLTENQVAQILAQIKTMILQNKKVQ